MIRTNAPARTWSFFANQNIFDIKDGVNAPFQIDAGAPSQSLRIGSTGRILFSISVSTTPQRSLHVIDTDMPTLRLEQSDNGGNPEQTYDVESSELGFNIIDVTNANKIPFSILPGAPTNSLFVAVNGSIGMGTATPDLDSRMDIRSSLLNGLLMKRADANAHFLRVENSASAFRCGVQGNGDAQFGALTPGKGLNLLAGGTTKLLMNSSGQISFGSTPPAIATDALLHQTGAKLTSGGVWTDASSRTFKQDIEPITSAQARETVLALQPVGYRYKNELDERYVGFIAEDVPELVATHDRKGLAPMDIVGVLTKVVQDQDRQLQDQRMQLTKERQRNDKLERQVESLMRRMADLEQ
jgi:hypothetical protein